MVTCSVIKKNPLNITKTFTKGVSRIRALYQPVRFNYQKNLQDADKKLYYFSLFVVLFTSKVTGEGTTLLSAS